LSNLEGFAVTGSLAGIGGFFAEEDHLALSMKPKKDLPLPQLELESSHEESE
jgi:hypothetical protein